MPTSENDGRERLYARYRRDRLLGATARDGPQGAPVSLGRLAVRLVLGVRHALLPQPPDRPRHAEGVTLPRAKARGVSRAQGVKHLLIRAQMVACAILEYPH